MKHAATATGTKFGKPKRGQCQDAPNSTSYFYEYEVDGHLYCTNRYTFADENLSDQWFQVGQEVTVSYDPANPQIAVLKRSIPIGVSVGGLLFGVATIVLLIRVVGAIVLAR